MSARTLLKLLPFVEDPDYEIEAVNKEKAEDVKRQQELFAQGLNKPPKFEDEEEKEREDDSSEKQDTVKKTEE